MPVDEQGQWYNPADYYAAASAPPQVLSTTTTLPDFASGSAEDIEATLAAHAYLRTALAGADNDVDWVAMVPGASALTVAYVNPGTNNAALSVAKSGNAITVNLATGPAGAITTTANDIVAAARASADVSPYVRASVAAGNTGAGVVIALAATGLGNWAASTLDVKLQISADQAATYYDSPEGAFAQLTGTGSAVQSRSYADLGDRARWVATVTGTVAFSIVARRRK